MLFDKFIENLPAIPQFRFFLKEDVNPLGRSRKIRLLGEPNDAMKVVHERFIRLLRSLPIRLLFATGARPYFSPRRNVMRHRHNRYFYTTDIKDAFESVDVEKLASILCDLHPKLGGCQAEIVDFLQKYCISISRRRGLIIGAPASPDLFNVYAGVLIDKPLGEFCKKYGITYTRYLDDLTFSSKRVTTGKRKRKVIREIVKSAGFVINHRKSRVYDLKKGPVEITGIGLEFGGRIFVPRHYTRKIKGLIHAAAIEKEISLHKVAGHMGVFRDITRYRDLNRIEKKLVEKYQKFRKERH